MGLITKRLSLEDMSVPTSAVKTKRYVNASVGLLVKHRVAGGSPIMEAGNYVGNVSGLRSWAVADGYPDSTSLGKTFTNAGALQSGNITASSGAFTDLIIPYWGGSVNVGLTGFDREAETSEQRLMNNGGVARTSRGNVSWSVELPVPGNENFMAFFNTALTNPVSVFSTAMTYKRLMNMIFDGEIDVGIIVNEDPSIAVGPTNPEYTGGVTVTTAPGFSADATSTDPATQTFTFVGQTPLTIRYS